MRDRLLEYNYRIVYKIDVESLNGIKQVKGEIGE